MKLPYGESNFKKVITQGYTYIDKTAYIARLEETGSHIILLRPRRFGKSLFLSALWHYYDVHYRDEFDTLFSQLYIGQHPTPLKSSYQVLFMEFSGIGVEGGRGQIYQEFDRKIAHALQKFLTRYGYPENTLAGVEREPSPQTKMEYFFRITAGQKILLLIDEYDHFANTILSQDLKLFQDVVGRGGFVRSFYETIKTATLTGTVDRLFITGVTPLMLDSMTSGFNIGENISLHEDFNSAVGFTPTEVASLLQPLTKLCQLDDEALLADVRRWYNGYRFNAQAEETVYNPNMVLYFLKNFRVKDCSYPEQMLDENIASDYGKIMGMFSIGNRDTNFAVLDDIINIGEVTAPQRRKFEFEKGFDRDDFISLLAYMGFVSLQRKTLSGDVFSIPNHAIQELYFHYFKVELERRNQICIPSNTLLQAVEALALHDDIQPLATEMQRVMQVLSNRDFSNMDEKHVKTLALTLLYQSSVYFIQSEREMNHKYPDILLLERSPYVVNYQHLIELKYAKRGDGEKGWEAKRQEGIKQVQGYLQLPEVAALPKLSAWVLLANGERVDAIKVS
ncbi:AAA family ATPase [Thiothrix subterranea]|uniref:AAA family ATPase n=1 Tax=Thiothrix subterranea TaxID=2735563 RepID=A0AA51QZ30_9GAMM|nr:AAA family ATPase [Thiothrix subterranea]MDQ5767316.1 AAA family ATPase [Thiothrix subterranea]WML88823.1 AAA family ATPase [Thiothrix subterranea]